MLIRSNEKWFTEVLDHAEPLKLLPAPKNTELRNQLCPPRPEALQEAGHAQKKRSANRHSHRSQGASDRSDSADDLAEPGIAHKEPEKKCEAKKNRTRLQL